MSSATRTAAAAALALFSLAPLSSALAQGAAGFPSKQILFIVTSPPGGSNDTFARAIGKKLSEAFGKPVIVENRPGATGSIGEGFVAKSAPAGTPKDVVAKLNGEINKALATDEMKDFLAREGAEAAPTTPEAFADLIRSDIARWKKVAASAGIKVD
jgi:tripartite-type tricarboxylate transporter receptor subunit TctC